MKILFVCTGNTCRSPMAEGIFRHEMEQRGFENIMCQNDDFFGAHSCAKATAFADVFRNCYLCHCNPPYFLTDQNRKTVDWQNFFIFPTGAGHKYPPDKLTFLSANRQDPFVPWSRRGEHLPRQRHLLRRLLHL